MKRLRLEGLAGLAAMGLVYALAAPAKADPKKPGELFRDPVLMLEHLPTRSGGLASDMDFLDLYGLPNWQQLADDVLLDTSAVISRACFWGFYDQDNPPASETMRLRIYAPRASDGLPGDILYEESFENPTRTATGYRIFTGVDPHEYFYDVTLGSPFALVANTLYWLEFVQVGDQSTHFRWENGQAVLADNAGVRNPGYPMWTWLNGRSNAAFQLWAVPEPCSLVLLCLGLSLAGHSRRGRRCRGFTN